MTQDIRPDSAAVLKGLKDFQRKTVDYVFKRLYEDEKPARRFLIADEVGLGKTLVARGLIARAIDRLWSDNVERIDVIYICSNADIARQNINRLNVTGGEDFEIATRITLLPIHLRDLKKNRLNFVSFTPGTSFNLQSGLGKAEERALLYWLLDKAWKLRGAAPLNVLQGESTAENFRKLVQSFRWRHDIDASLADQFGKSLDDHVHKATECGEPNLKMRFTDLCSRFARARRQIPPADREDRLRLVGELRNILAATCLKALEPDLIILDEFQRFKHLLDGTDKASNLARELFDYEGARVLLLSATPYKMYTLSHEAEVGTDDHYKDFVSTFKFLSSEANDSNEFVNLLQNYRRELFRLGSGAESQLRTLKLELETKLRSVMVRTEKLASSVDRDGMLKQVPASSARLSASDLRAYLAFQEIAKVLKQSDTLEYWKSSPYLLNFMEDYKIKDKFNESIELNLSTRELSKVIGRSESMLNWRAIRDYKHVDPANARMRALFNDMIAKGAWRLLWIPPSLPYYQLSCPFSNAELSGLTKRLVFSSWRVAPRAIACLLSYEAERLAIRSLDRRGLNTAEARKRRKGLLRFNRTDGRLAGMPVLGVLYPCKTLALECDPLKFVSASEELPALPQVVKAIGNRISELLTQIVPVQDDQPVDESWYWAAPILLDLKFDRKATFQWLEIDQLAERWSGAGDKSEDGEDSLWAEHVLEAQRLLTTPIALGKPPSDLADVLAHMSLGGPGITALRSLTRLSNGAVSSEIRTSAASVAWSFRHLYNMPEAMAMIRSMPGPTKDQPYWRRILEYGENGCLQSTMDEYAHVLRESLGLLDSSVDSMCEKIAHTMANALSLRISAMGVDNIGVDASGRKIELRKERLRGHFAVRFGDEKTDDAKEVSRAEQVRESFNSPFWPFVLATTSVGQEGLDFHHYCHAVVHWNLPSNPVDLEQREGRVHRYKGHAVRKNLAKRHGRQATSEVGSDPWEQMFAEAKRHRDPGISDIVPFWVFQTEDGACIERHVPAVPLSAEQEHLADLTKSLVVYRMVFGQSAQEDLTSYLRSNLPADQVEKISAEARICLEPNGG